MWRVESQTGKGRYAQRKLKSKFTQKDSKHPRFVALYPEIEMLRLGLYCACMSISTGRNEMPEISNCKRFRIVCLINEKLRSFSKTRTMTLWGYLDTTKNAITTALHDCHQPFQVLIRTPRGQLTLIRGDLGLSLVPLSWGCDSLRRCDSCSRPVGCWVRLWWCGWGKVLGRVNCSLRRRSCCYTQAFHHLQCNVRMQARYAHFTFCTDGIVHPSLLQACRHK